VEQPIYYWDPVIAPGDMILYTGNLFPCKGDLIIAALGTTQLVRLDIEDDRVIGEERLMVRLRRGPPCAAYVDREDRRCN
jgi:glucose/arabinose dehydrogenase